VPALILAGGEPYTGNGLFPGYSGRVQAISVTRLNDYRFMYTIRLGYDFNIEEGSLHPGLESSGYKPDQLPD
jgi:hypothetical protein